MGSHGISKSDTLRKYLPPVLAALLLVLAWMGVRFSPGFSETFAACFVASQVLVLLWDLLFSRLVGIAGALLLAVCTMIYAAGDDYLNGCILVSIVGMVVYAVALAVTGIAKGSCLSERVLRLALAGAGVFTFACGVFSTALLPLGIGALLCLVSRHLDGAGRWAALAGLVLCDLFLASPMCFPGGV